MRCIRVSSQEEMGDKGIGGGESGDGDRMRDLCTRPVKVFIQSTTLTVGPKNN